MQELSESEDLQYFITEVEPEGFDIPENAMLFARGNNLMVGIGEQARFEASGGQRFLELAKQFSEFTQQIETVGSVDSSAGSINAFAAVSFSPRSEFSSVLIVPKTLFVKRQDRSWVASFEKDLGLQALKKTSLGPRSNPALPPALNSSKPRNRRLGF